MRGDEGCFYAVYEDLVAMPSALLPYVKELSFRDTFRSGYAVREIGIYIHKTARAEVGMATVERGSAYTVDIKAKNLDDLKELYDLIRAGTIHATESHEGPQQGKTRAKLEAELKKVKGDLEIEHSKAKAAYYFAHELDPGYDHYILWWNPSTWVWPWCSKKMVSTRLLAALNDAPSKK